MSARLFLKRCSNSADHTKIVTRHIREECKERINRHYLTEHGKKLYKRRLQSPIFIIYVIWYLVNYIHVNPDSRQTPIVAVNLS